MVTKNPRLNVVLEPVLYETISRLAKKDKSSLSLVARDLLKEALEIHEDLCWQKAAEKRDKTFSYAKALSHKKTWKR